jgi:hypothetical protein
MNVPVAGSYSFPLHTAEFSFLSMDGLPMTCFFANTRLHFKKKILLYEEDKYLHALPRVNCLHDPVIILSKNIGSRVS